MDAANPVDDCRRLVAGHTYGFSVPFRIGWTVIGSRYCRRSGVQASPTPKGRYLASRTAATTLMLFLRTAAHRLGGNLESKLPATEDGGHYKVYRYFTMYRLFRRGK